MCTERYFIIGILSVFLILTCSITLLGQESQFVYGTKLDFVQSEFKINKRNSSPFIESSQKLGNPVIKTLGKFDELDVNTSSYDLPSKSFTLFEGDTIWPTTKKPVIYPKLKLAKEFVLNSNIDGIFRYLNVDQGLPSNFVYDIEIDKEDNFWFATFTGLAKYDGT